MTSSIYIYSEPRSCVDFGEVAAHIQARLPSVDVSVREPLLPGRDDPGWLEAASEKLALAKVRDLSAPQVPPDRLLPGEVAYELRRLRNSESRVYGLLYEAHLVADIFLSRIDPAETGIETVHVVFTDQLMGTWDEGDRRYHARTVYCGSPAVVSISGLVEAPARSPGYYLAKQGAEAFGLAEEAKMQITGAFADDCLSLDDPRLTEAAKGYAMQAIVYRITGEAFCGDPQCRLFNAHWQRELLEAQTGGGYEYCREHEEIFRRFDKEGTA